MTCQTVGVGNMAGLQVISAGGWKGILKFTGDWGLKNGMGLIYDLQQRWFIIQSDRVHSPCVAHMHMEVDSGIMKPDWDEADMRAWRSG